MEAVSKMKLTLGPTINSTTAIFCPRRGRHHHRPLPERAIDRRTDRTRRQPRQYIRHLVGALSPFRSYEMGGRLVNMIAIREDGAEEAEKWLRWLVTVIDVILNTVKAADDDAYAA
jgi:hypothetical protein